MGRGQRPAKPKVESKPSIARKSPKGADARVRELEKRLAEALAREKATGEILRVISNSPADLQPVLNTIAINAVRVCGAYDATVLLREGEFVRRAAHHGPLTSGREDLVPINRSFVSNRTILDSRPIHLHDVLSPEGSDFSDSRASAQRVGFRTILSVPLLHEGRAIGALNIRRREIRPFSDSQVALLQTFADQAVIAIENVRLFNETKDALERQTATSEILRVISTSPADVQPVLDVIARSARRLCEATDVSIFRRDDDRALLVAHDGSIESGTVGEFAIPLVGPMRRLVESAEVLHVADLQAESDEFPEISANARRLGFRAVLGVPLLREGVVIGAINLRRREAQLFTARQISLLQTFADQAVIAIENVRLFKELEARNRDLTESLERETATAEILRVISSSPTDIQPVLEAILDSGRRLCDAEFGAIFNFDGDAFVNTASTTITSEFGAWLRKNPIRPGQGTPLRRVAVERRPVQVADILSDPDFAPPDEYRREGMRTALAVPMLKEDALVGALTFHRRVVKPFADQQIALLQTFADQAVIAIENVRLFTELQEKNRALTQAHAQVTESLEQQTATSEILRVISSSPTDVQPVFDAIVANAAQLCGAEFSAVMPYEGGLLHLVAVNNLSPAETAAYHTVYPRSPGRDFVVGRAFVEARPVHVEDIEADADYDPRTREILGRAARYRTILGVPILRDGAPIGVIGCGRHQMKPFTAAQIELVKTFADQAVIAIENVRLFKELQARNNDLTATSQILQVIASSPTDLQPAFNVIASSALRLCDGVASLVFRYDGALLHLAASNSAEGIDLQAIRDNFPAPPERATFASRVVTMSRPLYISDIEHDPDAPTGLVEFARANGFRSIFAAPMRRDDQTIGVIAVTHRHVGGFTPEQGTLLKAFADQAVIAIENVRLFKELEARNRDLAQTLDQQTATSDILRVISGAHIDAQPVFDTIVQSAAQLCNATVAAVFRSDGGTVYNPANYGDAPDALAAVRSRYPRPVDMETMPGIAILTRSVVHFPDVEESPMPEHVRQVGRLLGFRSVVAVPMMREGEAVGALLVARREASWFSDAEVELLKTFGAQAVIAIENVRLFTELQARTVDLTRSVEKLTALGEVGRAVSSTLDLETVLTTIVSRAVELSGLDGGIVSEYEEATEEFVQRAASQTGKVLASVLRGIRYRKGEGAIGQTAITRQPVQVPDITVPGAYDSRVRTNLIESGVRAVLAVPMIHQDRLIGCLGVTRNGPGDFPPETIDLLRTFATQSALAIQNARLFREIEEKSRQLEVASHHKSEFLANMSHELRTPLNAIIGFSEVLTDRMFGDLNEKQEEYLKDIYASGTHLLSLINDILDLSKIEAGRMELELTDFHLPTALDNALTLVRERAGRRNITLQMSVDAQLGQIRADERKIRQVVLNLLSNAIKFTPEGGRIDVAAIPKDGLVEVSVSDTGVGIAPEDQEAVFEEFRQVGTAEKKAEGTGLGLTLCRKFIELHNGRIWVQSQVGAGSTFTFTIPVRRDEMS